MAPNRDLSLSNCRDDNNTVIESLTLRLKIGSGIFMLYSLVADLFQIHTHTQNKSKKKDFETEKTVAKFSCRKYK